MNSLTRLGAIVRAEQEHFLTAGATGADHAFTQAEFHLSWFQVGNHHDLPADKCLGIVSRFDARENLFPMLATKAKR